MKLNNSQFGEFELPETAVYEFRHGLLGFEELRQFGFLHLDEFAPLDWLVSVDVPEICFPLISPMLLQPGYLVPMGEVERRALDARPEDPVVPMVIVTVGSGTPRATANLRGPVMLNPKSRKGMQVVLFESGYPVRAEIPLIAETQTVR
ncbi:MAG TPA: flagellar assembly protein FliW [Candidatus Saccharimonadales bacterium]|nr:flagellar assembly protein FliW [Candidatus Saccharimonadales bacterium]